MSYPDGVTQAGLTEITQRFPVRDLLDPAIGKHIVLANRTYRRKTTGLRFGGYLEARTNVHWKITLTRVRARR